MGPDLVLARPDLGLETAADGLPEIELHAEAIGDFARECEAESAGAGPA